MSISEPISADLNTTDAHWSDLVPADDSLDTAEAGFAEAARAPSTLRGYRSDWAEFTTWCQLHGHTPLPADDIAISRYISTLAVAGAKTGTISRRLSTIKFAHKVRNFPDPTQTARITAVWEGIRRSLGTTPNQARPLMPPLLLDVLDACPTTTSWKTRPDEPSLTGARDRALLLLGFVSAMRPSEIAALTLNQIKEDDRGRVIQLTHSKTNQRGKLEHVVLPRGSRQATCPITALDHWLQLAGITDGPVFRKVTKGNKATTTALTTDGFSRVVTGAVGRAGYDPAGYSGHSLRAGFATYSVQRGATAQQVAHQTRHKSLASVGIYTRIEDAWEDNAATRLGL